MITLKHINYLLTVANTLHFKNVADAFFISPSTLNMAIADLEDQLGIKIFDRDNKQDHYRSTWANGVRKR
ncbi:MAG TPA: LysR family transcriptional regulator [Porticoccaceae bacterium]|jgi:DNA-binding transcriptional LysR family regulator|nr:LysR family transcriptional regulator [Gammaproteobacteria bacterium]HIL60497.1 LysR family transcriptional regulator [Porticoccaceae bacterium]